MRVVQSLKPLTCGMTETLSAALEMRNALDLFRAVETVAHEVIGFRMMTIMVFHHETSELERIYSNNVESYPTGGLKFKEPSPWKEQLLDSCTPILSNDSESVRKNFEDCEKLFSLGIGAILNIPVESNGKCIGTLNFGHQADWFSNDHIQVGLALAKYLESCLNNL